MSFLILKALHIIFIVTWFAGLFYIVRLFIYAAEANALEDQTAKEILLKQFLLMQRRLWRGISWPSAILSLGLGTSLLHYYPSIPFWLWLKLGAVLLLFLYHLSCELIFRDQQQGIHRYNSYQLRCWNEVATLFLFAIVFLVVLKENITPWGLALGLTILGGILTLAIKFYAWKRRKA